MSEQTESLGTLNLSGTDEDIAKLFRVFRDDREVTICQTDQGTIVVETLSWLRKNDRKEVRTVNAYTLETFTMMLETMHLGADYFGIDVKKGLELLHASDGDRINYEYAGAGVPKFVQAAADEAERNDETAQ
jgi:hypothetical protein